MRGTYPDRCFLFLPLPTELDHRQKHGQPKPQHHKNSCAVQESVDTASAKLASQNPSGVETSKYDTGPDTDCHAVRLSDSRDDASGSQQDKNLNSCAYAMAQHVVPEYPHLARRRAGGIVPLPGPVRTDNGDSSGNDACCDCDRQKAAHVWIVSLLLHLFIERSE